MARNQNVIQFDSLSDAELIMAIEDSFDVSLDAEDLLHCESVGQLYDLIVASLSKNDGHATRCLTATSFFKLRSALRHLGFKERVTLATDLNGAFKSLEKSGIKESWETLANASGLKLPVLEISTASTAVLCGLNAIFIVMSVILGSWLPVMAGIAGIFLLAKILPVEVPVRHAKMRNLVECCAAYNFSRLSNEFETPRPNDIWNALTVLIRDITGFGSQIDPTTRFGAS